VVAWALEFFDVYADLMEPNFDSGLIGFELVAVQMTVEEVVQMPFLVMMPLAQGLGWTVVLEILAVAVQIAESLHLWYGKGFWIGDVLMSHETAADRQK
jgi:hypothetical protein